MHIGKSLTTYLVDSRQTHCVVAHTFDTIEIHLEIQLSSVLRLTLHKNKRHCSGSNCNKTEAKKKSYRNCGHYRKDQ